MTSDSTLFTLCGVPALRDVVETSADLDGQFDPVPRRVVAQALNLALLADLLDRVPSGRDYVGEQVGRGRRICLDHGAVRTVAWPNAGALPPGVEQVRRILEPLGYEHRETYPLARLRMTGMSFAHRDLPEEISQWFVSELHPAEFSPAFRTAVERVLGTSVDPLDAATVERLERLGAEGSLPLADATALVPVLVGCFRRLHAPVLSTDYDILAAESPEMAWIATEGTSFNHATDRVPDVEHTAVLERGAGRPIKDTVEVSRSGRVRQTAHRATIVTRPMSTAEGDIVNRDVPGSFFEFISRSTLPGGERLDLAFDAANAQGIFAMTRVDQDGPGR